MIVYLFNILQLISRYRSDYSCYLTTQFWIRFAWYRIDLGLPSWSVWRDSREWAYWCGQSSRWSYPYLWCYQYRNGHLFCGRFGLLKCYQSSPSLVYYCCSYLEDTPNEQNAKPHNCPHYYWPRSLFGSSEDVHSETTWIEKFLWIPLCLTLIVGLSFELCSFCAWTKDLFLSLYQLHWGNLSVGYLKTWKTPSVYDNLQDTSVRLLISLLPYCGQRSWWWLLLDCQHCGW